jgi:hypothetical protein
MAVEMAQKIEVGFQTFVRAAIGHAHDAGQY